MTPEQQANYESARAQADAIYSRMMMEAKAIPIRAMAPPKPKPSLWQRIRAAITGRESGNV